jgi:hypothetical protein
MRNDARAFLETLQQDRPILEEIYLWKHDIEETKVTGNAEELGEQLWEGLELADALFAILDTAFDIKPIHEPGALIRTPLPRGRRYKFHETYQKGLNRSRVLFPGLCQRGNVISPCEIAQLDANAETEQMQDGKDKPGAINQS